MDVSIEIFLDAEELEGVLRLLSDAGAAIFYQASARGPHARVAPRSPLPDDLQKALRRRFTGKVEHCLDVVLDGGGASLDDADPERVISVRFGGYGPGALHLSSISARSTEAPTLDLMRRVKQTLSAISKTGVEVVGEGGGRRYVMRSIRFTEGARRAVDEGLTLRQRPLIDTHFELPAGAPAAKKTAKTVAKKTAKTAVKKTARAPRG